MLTKAVAERVPDKALYGRFYSQYFSVPIAKGCNCHIPGQVSWDGSLAAILQFLLS